MVMVNYTRKMGQHTLQRKCISSSPCTIWANESTINAWWLLAHGLALCNEYTHRYGKEHSCEKTLVEATKIILSAEYPYKPSSFVFAGPINSSMIKLLIFLLHTKDILLPNLGHQQTIFVIHLETRLVIMKHLLLT